MAYLNPCGTGLQRGALHARGVCSPDLAAPRPPPPQRRPHRRPPPPLGAPAARRPPPPPPPALYRSGPLPPPARAPAPAPAAATSSTSSSSQPPPPPGLFEFMRPAGYLDVGSVPSGDTLQHSGDLVIHGSVAKGAKIVASGDVVCLGSLQGAVHAGADLGAGGNEGARVVALEMRGARLRIAGVKTLGDAKVTVPGPHCAYIAASGPAAVIQLQPLGRTRPAPSIAAIGASFWRWRRAYPAAAASLVTGLYAAAAGAALIAAPKAVFGLLFDASKVPEGWIRVGGVLFATFGLQYLGTAWGDWRGVSEARRSHRSEVAGLEKSMEREREGLAARAASARAAATHDGPLPDGPPPRAATPMPPAGAPPSAPPASAAAAEHERRSSNLLYSSTSFYSASVWSRLALAAAFCALVATGNAEPGLLALAAVNALGAATMAAALKRQWAMHMMN